MPLGYTEEEVKKLKINKFQTLADFQAAQNAHLIGDDEISMIEEIMHPDWDQNNPNAPDYIKNKPNLATVATSGSYNDLTDTPDIVQADWAESDSGDGSYIRNKPILVTITSKRWTNS